MGDLDHLEYQVKMAMLAHVDLVVSRVIQGPRVLKAHLDLPVMLDHLV